MGCCDYLFPTPTRNFPGMRWVKILLRAIHVLFVAGLIGASMFAEEESTPWFQGTLISGLAILFLDLYASAVFVLQVRGLIIFLKAGVLIFLTQLGDAAPWALCGLLLISVVSSHAPSKFRYFLLVGRGRLTPSTDKG